MDKNRRKQTKEGVNGETGLTPNQERAAIMLASGKGITAVSEELGINRQTIYKWQTLITFRCYYNRQCQDYRDNIVNGLYGLADDAITAIRESLKNPTTRLKAAMWIVERIDRLEDIEETDARAELKAKNMEDPDLMYDGEAYNDDLKKFGLDSVF